MRNRKKWWLFIGGLAILSLVLFLNPPVVHAVSTQPPTPVVTTIATSHWSHHTREFIGYWGLVALITATTLSAGWWLSRQSTNRPSQQVPLAHTFDTPPVSPALAQVLGDQHWPDPDALTGDIIATVTRQDLTMTLEQETIRFTKTNPVANHFLQQCFDHLGSGNRFTLTELMTFATTDKQGLVSHWFRDWQLQVNAAASHYQDPHNTAYQQHLWTFALGLTGLILGWLGFSWAISFPLLIKTAMVSGVLLLLIWGYLLTHHHVTLNTTAGQQIVTTIRACQHLFKASGHLTATQLGDLPLWEPLLPYAVAFGQLKPVTKQLTDIFGPGQVRTTLATTFALYYPVGPDQPLAATLDEQLTHAINLSTSVHLAWKSNGHIFSTGPDGEKF